MIIMQLVEQGLVDRDARVSQYGVEMDNPAMTVRHLWTHTAEGVIWLLATLLLGAVPLGIHALTHPSPRKKPLAKWQLAGGAFQLVMSSYTPSRILAIGFLKSLGRDRDTRFEYLGCD
jgi:CubicO group peptidase (beta-lactamase class C family)